MKLYHGTTRSYWDNPESHGFGTPFELHVTTDPEDAKSYAESALESQCADLPEEEWDRVEPVLVEFDKADLDAETDLEYMCDDAIWDTGRGKTWQDSLQQAGCFAIDGFTERHKALGKVMSATPESTPTP